MVIPHRFFLGFLQRFFSTIPLFISRGVPSGIFSEFLQGYFPTSHHAFFLGVFKVFFENSFIDCSRHFFIAFSPAFLYRFRPRFRDSSNNSPRIHLGIYSTVPSGFLLRIPSMFPTEISSRIFFTKSSRNVSQGSYINSS